MILNGQGAGRRRHADGNDNPRQAQALPPVQGADANGVHGKKQNHSPSHAKYSLDALRIRVAEAVGGKAQNNDPVSVTGPKAGQKSLLLCTYSLHDVQYDN
jgi:hypothetical protein